MHPSLLRNREGALFLYRWVKTQLADFAQKGIGEICRLERKIKWIGEIVALFSLP